MAPGATTDAECAALTTPSADKRTCNGDGDGQIDYDNNNPAPNSPYEASRAWQHLANAGLVEGSYTGIEPSVNKPRVNYPAAKISNGVFTMWYLQGRNVWGWAPSDPGHYIGFGSVVGPSANRWHNEILKPDEAHSIDRKIDDGMPYRGKVNDIRSVTVPVAVAYTPECAITDTDEASEYKLTSSIIACNLIISAF